MPGADGVMRTRLARLGVGCQEHAQPAGDAIILADPGGTRIVVGFAPADAHG